MLVPRAHSLKKNKRLKVEIKMTDGISSLPELTDKQKKLQETRIAEEKAKILEEKRLAEEKAKHAEQENQRAFITAVIP
jgi:hypothetical protein